MAKKKAGAVASKKQAESNSSGSSNQAQNSGKISGGQAGLRSQKNSGNSRGKKSGSQSKKSKLKKSGKSGSKLKDIPMIVNAQNAGHGSNTIQNSIGKQGEGVQNVLQNDDLTAKQDIFCREYLVDLNATQAAIRAGYSQETAYSIGSENLKKPEVQKRISSYMQDRLKRVDVTQEMIIRELAKIAFANIKEYLQLSENGQTTFIEWDQLDSDKTAAISEVTTVHLPGKAWKAKIKMHDKMEALKLIGQHLGMFKIGIDANVKQMPGEYDLSKFSTDQLKTFMELTRIISES